MDFLQSLTNCTQDKVFLGFSLKSSCGYGVGGTASYYVEPTTVLSLRTIIDLCNEHAVKYKIIGNGTNLLISDKGFNGTIICTKQLKGIKEHNGKIVCASGENLSSLINYCFDKRFRGLEQLCGIPASIGGAVYMNASAYETTISDFIESVDLIKDGKLLKLDKCDLDFGYRKSVLQKLKLPIITVTFNLPKQNTSYESKELIKFYTSQRKITQPKGKSCGSVFKNTTQFKAGFLIDQAGLKGTTVGRAMVSDKHANFIITGDGATANDVYSLIKIIKDTVKEKFNVELKEEIEYVGEF